eukprot:Nitzschia sp. Nitz4//scaffold76_size158648//8356//9309//NITZ4_002527-RA/size158648-processed-gene-0.225-mRNA-1//1//CDS//3329557788//6646//frame0
MWIQLHVALMLDFLLSSYSFSLFHPVEKAPANQLHTVSVGHADSISIVHMGNSIQYYNDNPRLLEHMLKTHYKSVTQDSCLRGGANFTSLWEEGNGMEDKFNSTAALLPDGSYDIGSPTVEALLSKGHIDFAVMNDYTQNPAREETRNNSIEALKEYYIPLFEKIGSPTVVFLMTFAYREPEKGSETLGTYDEFVAKLYEGYKEYQKHVPDSKVAPVGLAFQRARQKYPPNDQGNFSWEDLYAIDNVHPSPKGSLLEAYVLYATIVDQAPPEYDPSWWDTARYFQPPDQPPLPFPTEKEASLLWELAVEVCNVHPTT